MKKEELVVVNRVVEYECVILRPGIHKVCSLMKCDVEIE